VLLECDRAQVPVEFEAGNRGEDVICKQGRKQHHKGRAAGSETIFSGVRYMYLMACCMTPRNKLGPLLKEHGFLPLAFVAETSRVATLWRPSL